MVRGNKADPASASTILVLDALGVRTNHNGGGIVFGRDGKLYVGVGDARTSTNAPSLATRHGKALRLNDDGSIPADNPRLFAGIAGSPAGDNRAIWAVGLRNPFRLAVHPHIGRIFINDVGENRFEEINDGRAGANYGWPASKGSTTLPGIDQPILSYAHNGGTPTGCAITWAAPSIMCPRAAFPLSSTTSIILPITAVTGSTISIQPRPRRSCRSMAA